MYRIESVTAVMVPINSVGQTICAMIEVGMITAPTLIAEKVISG